MTGANEHRLMDWYRDEDQAQLTLDRQEADLLRSLALEGLETPAARAFLERIPTVGELVPSARLREIEQMFDSEASR